MPLVNALRPNFEKRTINGIPGLVEVIVQNYETKEVLMLAYTDEPGWRLTLKSGLASFYSTSRGRSWIKGEESGNFMKVVDMLIDCDGDALIYLVVPKGQGLACHTNARTCFYRQVIDGRMMTPAPKAGEKEALPLVEVESHADLF